MCVMLTWQYGERTRAAGVGRGGFLSVFWAGGGEGSGCVLFLGQSGDPPLWVSPLGVYLGDLGFVPLRGLAFGHFVHGTFTQAIMDTYFPTVELDVHVHG